MKNVRSPLVRCPSVIPAAFAFIASSASGDGRAYFVMVSTEAGPPVAVDMAPPAGASYGAAAPAAGERWNKVPYVAPTLNPAGMIGNPAAGSATGTYVLRGAPLPLVDSLGAPSPVELSVAVNYAGNTANGISAVSQSGASPAELFGSVWRLTNGANSLSYTVAGLSTGAVYDLYLYAAGASATQRRGATFTLAADNVPDGGASSVQTEGVASSSTSAITLFDTAGTLINQGATWTLVRVKSDAAGRVVFTQSRHPAGQNWFSGFQLAPVSPAVAIPWPASSQIARPGGSASFIAETVAPAGALFRWYFDDAPLFDGIGEDGAVVSGAATPALALSNLQPGRAGRYRLRVSSGDQSVASPDAALTFADFDPPQIPARDVRISDHGATPDDASEDTVAIQASIDAVSLAGGGTVRVPPGVYLSGPLVMRDRVHLRLAPGAVLRMLPMYSWPNTPYYSGTTPDFIQINGRANVVVSGFGRIEGQGQAWWDRVDGSNGVTRETTLRPGSTIGMNDSASCAILDVSTLDPPNLHFGIKRCRDVVVANATLRAPADSPNTDGINIAGRNLVIDRCDISTGDDNVVINSGTSSGETRDIRIVNSVIGYGHGCSIGSYTSGGSDGAGGYYGIRNVVVDRLTFNGTLSALTLKSSPGRGGVVQNLDYTNLTMNNVGSPFTIHSYYGTVGSPGATGSNGPTPTTAANYNAAPPVALSTALLPEWRDILLSDIVVNGCTNYAVIWGLPNRPARGVTLRNIRYTGSWGLRVYNATDVVFAGENTFALPANRPLLTTYNANIISTSPVSATIDAGETAVFSAATAGSSGQSGAGPAVFWRLNGETLVDGTRADGTVVSGASTRTLTLRNAGRSSAGICTFVAENLLDGHDASIAEPASIVARAESSATLTVLSPFESWGRALGLDPAADGAATADPDGDGLLNLVEYACGLDPAKADAAAPQASGAALLVRGVPTVLISGPGAAPVVRFVRRKDRATVGLVYTPCFSADLLAWSVSAVDPVVIAQDAGHELVELPFPSDIGGDGGRCFFRLVVDAR